MFYLFQAGLDGARDGLDGLTYRSAASAELAKWLGWLGSLFLGSLIFQELRLVLAFLVMAITGLSSVRGRALFRPPLISHLLICLVPNKASLRANPESRGGKVDSTSDGRSDEVSLQRGMDIGMGLGSCFAESFGRKLGKCCGSYNYISFLNFLPLNPKFRTQCEVVN